MIKVIIFDYDGVIVDSFPVIHQVYKIICKTLGKECPQSISKFREQYGLHSRHFYKTINLSPEELVQADTIFRKEIVKLTPPIFPGIKTVLKKLSSSYRLVVLSSTHQNHIIDILKQGDILSYFERVEGQGAALGPLSKRKRLPLFLKELGVSKDEVIMVGDREVDYFAAQEAGVDNLILVEYGWGYDPAQVPKYKSRMIVKKPMDLLKAVEKF